MHLEYPMQQVPASLEEAIDVHDLWKDMESLLGHGASLRRGCARNVAGAKEARAFVRFVGIGSGVDGGP